MEGFGGSGVELELELEVKGQVRRVMGR